MQPFIIRWLIWLLCPAVRLRIFLGKIENYIRQPELVINLNCSKSGHRPWSLNVLKWIQATKKKAQVFNKTIEFYFIKYEKNNSRAPNS